MTDREMEMAEARRLSRLLVMVSEQAKAGFAAAVVPLGLPVPLARALLVLSEPTPMSELAEQLACDPSYVTGLADQLEERGLVIRVPGRDRRVKMLQVTDDGGALRDRVFEAVDRRGTIAQRLTTSQRSTLGQLLEHMLEPDLPTDPRKDSAQ